MSTDLVLRTPDEAFTVAERISKSNLVPTAYRGKPSDLAIALMFGAEIGLPPMASMLRVIVVEGKPGLDAQGMVAVIRGAGHSITGVVTSERAFVKGKRADNGDEMTVTFTFAQAAQIGLTKKQVWKDYPQAMLWARGVSQLARMLFADVLMGLSYTPDELQEIAESNGHRPVLSEGPEEPAKPSRRRAPPGTKAEDDDIADGELVLTADEVKHLGQLLAKVPTLKTAKDRHDYVSDFIGHDHGAPADLTREEYDRLMTELELLAQPNPETGEIPMEGEQASFESESGAPF